MRMLVCLGAILVAGAFVLSQMGTPVTARAGWYEMALTFIGILMCWGGVEASCWMLRKSPIAKTTLPKSDWGRLWIWSGIPSGAFMLAWLLFGWASFSFVPREIAVLTIGQALMGPALWMLSTPWMIKETQIYNKGNSLLLMLLGSALLLHGLGVAFAMYIFPHFSGASLRSVFAMMSALAGYYPLAFFHLLLIGCSCWVADRFGFLPIKK